MANEEHLARLKQEVSAWDAWRLENPTIQPDLRAADLRGAHLRRARLSMANLSRADLSGADLTAADLRGAHLIGANLTAAHLAEAQSASQHPGSVPFSVNADGGFLSVASPERRHRGPCENQQTTEEGRRQAWALRRGD
jgi:hypothetical protein